MVHQATGVLCFQVQYKYQLLWSPLYPVGTLYRTVCSINYKMQDTLLSIKHGIIQICICSFVFQDMKRRVHCHSSFFELFNFKYSVLQPHSPTQWIGNHSQDHSGPSRQLDSELCGWPSALHHWDAKISRQIIHCCQSTSKSQSYPAPFDCKLICLGDRW